MITNNSKHDLVEVCFFLVIRGKTLYKETSAKQGSCSWKVSFSLLRAKGVLYMKVKYNNNTTKLQGARWPEDQALIRDWGRVCTQTPPQSLMRASG